MPNVHLMISVNGRQICIYDTTNFMICTLCENLSESFVLPPLLCWSCEQQILSLAVDSIQTVGGVRIHVLFKYESYVRTLILRSKVLNDPVAVGFLLKLIEKQSQNVLDSMRDSGTLVLPAPSSFWGRVRGRFDIAQLMATSLFDRRQVYTGIIPGTFFRPKRAGGNDINIVRPMYGIKFTSFFNRFLSNQSFKTRISRAKRILLVDDVMTTGFTMSLMIEQIKRLGAQSIEGLVIASPSMSRNNFQNELAD